MKNRKPSLSKYLNFFICILLLLIFSAVPAQSEEKKSNPDKSAVRNTSTTNRQFAKERKALIKTVTKLAREVDYLAGALSEHIDLTHEILTILCERGVLPDAWPYSHLRTYHYVGHFDCEGKKKLKFKPNRKIDKVSTAKNSSAKVKTQMKKALEKECIYKQENKKVSSTKGIPAVSLWVEVRRLDLSPPQAVDLTKTIEQWEGLLEKDTLQALEKAGIGTIDSFHVVNVKRAPVLKILVNFEAKPPVVDVEFYQNVLLMTPKNEKVKARTWNSELISLSSYDTEELRNIVKYQIGNFIREYKKDNL